MGEREEKNRTERKGEIRFPTRKVLPQRRSMDWTLRRVNTNRCADTRQYYAAGRKQTANSPRPFVRLPPSFSFLYRTPSYEKCPQPISHFSAFRNSRLATGWLFFALHCFDKSFRVPVFQGIGMLVHVQLQLQLQMVELKAVRSTEVRTTENEKSCTNTGDLLITMPVLMINFDGDLCQNGCSPGLVCTGQATSPLRIRVSQKLWAHLDWLRVVGPRPYTVHTPYALGRTGCTRSLQFQAPYLSQFRRS